MKKEQYRLQKEALEQQKRLTEAYERFVPHEFLDFLGKEDIVDVELGDQTEKIMTVLFSDIRSFTELSESMTPQDNFRFLNSYLKRMEPAIRGNHGIIDKFIGDAIMALFETSAEHALDAAIGMKLTLLEYNAIREEAGWMPIDIGIGLNTGRLMLGTIGSKTRMEGTVISDNVNLASRIESLTKLYKCSLLISENTFYALDNPHKYLMRLMGKVYVKGKTKPTAIWEVFNGDFPQMQDGKMKSIKYFENGVTLFGVNEFSEAEQNFRECLKICPEDTSAEYYRQLCIQHMGISSMGLSEH